VNAQLDWPACEDALKIESVQFFVRFEISHQAKLGNTWKSHHRYGLIALQMTKLEIVCSRNQQANRAKVWQFGQAGDDLAEGHQKNWHLDVLQRGETVADDGQILQCEFRK